MILGPWIITLAALAGGPDPWADEIISVSASLDASGLYNDPLSVLGAPATTYYDDFEQEQFEVSLVAAPFNLDHPGGERLITTLAGGAFIKLRFDEPVGDDPRNPYGADLIVFGNAFFTSLGKLGPDADMSAVVLTGGLVAEPITVAVSSTGLGTPASDPAEWYVFTEGPSADTLFPTNAWAWDTVTETWAEPLDGTRPVNPDFGVADFAGLTAAEAISRYAGSAGGTPFDLAESGYATIRYVYLSGFGGEVDALADIFAALGDCDRDGDVDLADAAGWQRGAGRDPLPADCFCADADGDQDVDAADHESFSAFLDASGPRS